MVCLEFGASEFGASEGMAKEGALIWDAPEKCPILAQRFLEHNFFEAGHTEQGCADLPNIYWCQPCAGGWTDLGFIFALTLGCLCVFVVYLLLVT